MYLLRCHWHLSHIVLHVHIVDVATRLSNDLSSLFGRDLSDFNLSFPVSNAVFELTISILLLNELEWIGHVLHILHQPDLLPVVDIDSFDNTSCLLDIYHSLFLLLNLDLHLGLNPFLLFQCIMKLFLKAIQSLNCFTRIQFEREQFLVSLIDVFDMLLILNLKLMEINKLELITHFLLVLDLCVSL